MVQILKKILIINITFWVFAPSDLYAQGINAQATAAAFNALTNRMKSLEDRMESLEDGWNKLLNVAVVGFRGQQCPAGWNPISNGEALLMTDARGGGAAVRLTGAKYEALTAQSVADGLAVKKILFCVRSTTR
ncbi:hypothetical protein H2509_00770 [Stappia sp. F7233]|jgi:hypothetical protein|uniref:Uncharacterized protein n=1 Tax=Stappia albiluteola TaxID=2758565 RepID=A0A839A8J8_9HYPH|nr:hypothetical protein [Stappia albiluteola]MBA5775651.1 hypothetical protein [Stappia albiluteola]